MSGFPLRTAVAAMLFAVCAPFAVATDDAGLLPVKDFARDAQLMSPRLSPDGQHLAVRVDYEEQGQHALMVYNIADMSKPLSMLRLPKFELPAEIDWASPTRLVVAIGKQYGSLGKPGYTGEILGTDLDGKNQAYLYGYKYVGGRREATRSLDQGWGTIDSFPEHANGHFYMSTESYDENDNHSHLYDVDAVHNTRHLIGDIDVGGLEFMVGADGTALYAYGSDQENRTVVYHRVGGDWVQMDPAQVGKTFVPITYTPDHQHIYALYSADGGPDLVCQVTAVSIDGAVATATVTASYLLAACCSGYTFPSTTLSLRFPADAATSD